MIVWVMTIGLDEEIEFWESLTGNRHIYSPEQSSAILPYHSIGCVFNHFQFYANIQKHDLVQHCDFHLTNSLNWKAMKEAPLLGVSRAIHRFDNRFFDSLHPPKIQKKNLHLHSELEPNMPSIQTVIHSSCIAVDSLEREIEHELKFTIEEYRRNTVELSTRWDSSLVHLLGHALHSYELERVTGGEFSNIGNKFFQESIQRLIPEGYQFKVYIFLLYRDSPFN